MTIAATTDTPMSGQNAALVKEGSIETFQVDILDASQTCPIIVDFWAPWCGPCKTLIPMLERAVTARAGKLRLVKIDIDKNQMIAQQLRIQSVPTVMAFIAGQPADGFQGALPEREISVFLDRVLQTAEQAGLGGGNDPAAPETILEAGFEALATGDLTGAMQLFGSLAQSVEPGSEFEARALAGLVQCHLENGNTAEAHQLSGLIPEPHRGIAEVAKALAAVALAGHADAPSGASELEALKARVTKAPEDPEARYALANGLAAAGQMAAAADALLIVIEQDRDWEEGAARQKLLMIFEALGPGDPIVIKARRALSSILFS